MNPLQVLPAKPEAKQLPHTYCTALRPFLPGHAQAREPFRDDEDVQTWEGVDPQDRVSCSQALRQQSKDPQLRGNNNRSIPSRIWEDRIVSISGSHSRLAEFNNYECTIFRNYLFTYLCYISTLLIL